MKEFLFTIALFVPETVQAAPPPPKIAADAALSYAYECEDLLKMTAGQKRALRKWLTGHEDEPPTVEDVSRKLDTMLTAHQRAAWHTALVTTGKPGKQPMTLGRHHLMYVPHGRPGLRWAAYVGEPIHVGMPPARAARRHELMGDALKELWIETGTSFNGVYRAVKRGTARIEVIRDGNAGQPRVDSRDSCSFVIVDLDASPIRIAVLGENDYWLDGKHLATLADAVTAVKAERRDNQPAVVICVGPDLPGTMQTAPDGTELWLPKEVAAAVKRLSDALDGIGAGNVGVRVPIAPLSPHGPPSSGWSDVQGGARVRLTVSPGPVAHPGEWITIGLHMYNTTDRALMMPRQSGGFVDGELHVRTPSGEEYAYHGGVDFVNAVLTEALRIESLARRIALRLTGPLDAWRAVAGGNARPLSFRKPGKYTFWCRIEAQSGWSKQTQTPEWTGKATTAPVQFTVTEMPPHLRRAGLTCQQVRDLQTLLGSTASSDYQRAQGRIQKAIVRADNEALAMRMVELIEKRINDDPFALNVGWQNLVYYLTLRAAGDGRALGIDGPYLPRFARLCLKIIERQLAEPQDRWSNWGHPWSSIVAYLSAHGDDTALRDGAVRLAKRYAKLPKQPADASLPVWRDDSRTHHLAHVRLGFAWQALTELGVLKDGITLDEAKAILGPPTLPQLRNEDDPYVHWHYHSTMHTNPRLVADLRNGKLYNIRVGSRK